MENILEYLKINSFLINEFIYDISEISNFLNLHLEQIDMVMVYDNLNYDIKEYIKKSDFIKNNNKYGAMSSLIYSNTHAKYLLMEYIIGRYTLESETKYVMLEEPSLIPNIIYEPYANIENYISNEYELKNIISMLDNFLLTIKSDVGIREFSNNLIRFELFNNIIKVKLYERPEVIKYHLLGR